MLNNSLKNRNFLTLLDFTSTDIKYLLELAAELKAQAKQCNFPKYLKDKSIALIFEKTSTRTRCSFQTGAQQMGAHVTYISSNSQMGIKETVQDTAHVLGRFYDGIEFRGSKQSDVEDLAKYSGKVVWNGLTDDYHPTQTLADFLTVQEHLGHNLKGKKLVYFGDTRNNVAVSLMIGCAKMGMHFVGAGPKHLLPKANLLAECKQMALETGGTVTFDDDAMHAAQGADILYTDVWVSMGEPDSIWVERVAELRPYQINAEIMAAAKDTAIFLHCLPAYHNLDTKIGATKGPIFNLDAFEVTDEVFRSPQSKVFDQAENRLHTIKAIMAATLGE